MPTRGGGGGASCCSIAGGSRRSRGLKVTVGLALAVSLEATSGQAVVQPQRSDSSGFANAYGRRSSLLVNPLGIILSGVVSGAAPEIETFWSVGFRYQQLLSKQWGLAVIPQLGHAEVVGISLNSLGLKVGPRFDLSGSGFDGGYLLPLAVFGSSWVSQPRRNLLSRYQLGVGLEGGYCWAWRSWAIELGVGAHYSGYVVQYSFDGQPTPGAGFRPLLNTSVGYVW